MAATTNVQVIVDAKDNASATLKNVGNGIREVGEKSQVTTGQLIAGTAALGAMVGGAVKLIGSMVGVASSMEQNRIAFQTMLGSADLAKKTLTDLSNFAMKTPFNLPQVVEASQRLLAYNVSAEELIPTLTTLGNISAGVGREKLPQLILAFGQVKAATKLTGMELRQFSEAGVPLLQALVDQANEAGGAWVTVGGVSTKTKGKLDALNTTLAKQTNRLNEMVAKGKTTSATYQNLQIDVAATRSKIAALGDTTGATSKVFQKTTVTAEQMKDMISDGKVSFDQVQKALDKLSNTKFAGLMIEQSKSLGGIVSNLQDVWSRFSMSVIGVQANGDIREGSIFTMLKKGALALLGVLEKVQEPFIAFIDSIVQNQAIFSTLMGAIAGLVAVIGVGLVMSIAAVLSPIAGLIALFVAVGAGVGLLVNKFGGFENIINIIKGVVDSVGGEFSKLETVIKGYLDNFQGMFDAFVERTYDTFKLNADNIGFGDFFSQMMAKITPLLNEVTVQIQQGFQNAFNLDAGGEGGGFEDTLGRIMSMIQPAADLFMRVLTPAINQLKDSFIQSKPFIDEFLQLLGPILIDGLKAVAGAIAILIGFVALLISAFVQAFALAMPAIINFFVGILEIFDGILLFFGGFFMILTGNFRDGFTQIFEGVKSIVKGIWDVISGAFIAILAFIAGFIKGVIDFFKNLYNVLVGNSIVPDLVNKIISLFTDLADKVIGLAKSLYQGVTETFEKVKQKVIEAITAAKDWIAGQIGDWMSWGRNLGNAFVDGFWNALSALKQKAIDALNAAKSVLQGHSPPQSGPFKKIDDWGYSIGDSWVQGFAGAIGGLSSELRMPMATAVPTMSTPSTENQVNDQESRTIGGGVDEGVGGGVSFNVTIGLYAGSETEKRNIARDLYSALVQVADAQNKTVKELMGA